MVISAIVTPREDLINDRRLRTWPRKVTKTVTKDNSIVFANRAKRMEAVSGVKSPPECIARPYRGCTIASTKYIPENKVEYTERARMEIESQLLRFAKILLLAAQGATGAKSPTEVSIASFIEEAD